MTANETKDMLNKYICRARISFKELHEKYINLQTFEGNVWVSAWNERATNDHITYKLAAKLNGNFVRANKDWYETELTKAWKDVVEHHTNSGAYNFYPEGQCLVDKMIDND